MRTWDICEIESEEMNRNSEVQNYFKIDSVKECCPSCMRQLDKILFRIQSILLGAKHSFMKSYITSLKQYFKSKK